MLCLYEILSDAALQSQDTYRYFWARSGFRFYPSRWGEERRGSTRRERRVVAYGQDLPERYLCPRFHQKVRWWPCRYRLGFGPGVFRRASPATGHRPDKESR